MLSAQYGEHGTPQRAEFDRKAKEYCVGVLLQEARREANVTQRELAEMVGKKPSFISQIERGIIEPTVSMFYTIIGALGMRVDIVRTV